MKRIIPFILLATSINYSPEFQYSRVLAVPDLSFYPGVLTGLDILEEMAFEPLRGSTLVVLTNQTAVNRKGTHLLDLLATQQDDLAVKIIFAPEFGLFAQEPEGVTFHQADLDSRFGAPVKSLWGRKFRPDRADLYDVDLVLIDLQDPGVRYFSFMTTVTKVMEAAAIADVPVMVLDRPNPLNGTVIDGPVVRPRHQSFVGYHLVPIRHGLTIGEYALMVNEMGWIRGGERVDLTVVPMVNWERDMWMDETGLPWVPVAPAITEPSQLIAYEGLGLLQGTNLSDGTGTDLAYLQVGAPWISAEALLSGLERKKLPGVHFSAVAFIPDSLSAFVSNPRYRGEECGGIRFEISDRDQFSPLLTIATILSIVSRRYPNEFRWVANNYVDKLYGHDYLRVFLAQERDPSKLPATWTHDIIKFSQFREKFLLY